MTPFAGRRLLAVLLLVGAGLPARAGGPTPAGVVDDAGLFRPETLGRAEELISALRHEYHFDVRVETLAALPPDEQKALDALSRRKAKGRYVARISRERAEKAEVNGLYVLICTEPRFVQVVASPPSAEAYFSSYKQGQLRQLFEKRLAGSRAGQGRDDAAGAAVGFAWRARPPAGADAALLDALAQVRAGLRSQAGDPNAIGPWPVAVLLAGTVGLWLFLTLIRNRLTGRAHDEGVLRPDPTPALLASQFGTPAAYWIYDRLFPGLHAAPPNPPPPPPELPADDSAVNGPSALEPDSVDTAARDRLG